MGTHAAKAITIESDNYLSDNVSTLGQSVVFVPDSKSRNIPEVVLVRRWVVGILGIWRGGVGWVKGGAVGVSLQAT